MADRSPGASCCGKWLPHEVVFRFGPRSEATHLTNYTEEQMKKQREVVTQSQKVDVYLHFLPPERPNPRPAGVLERVRLLAVGSLATVMTAIGIMRMLG
jgi:hypothetical protein